MIPHGRCPVADMAHRNYVSICPWALARIRITTRLKFYLNCYFSNMIFSEWSKRTNSQGFNFKSFNYRTKSLKFKKNKTFSVIVKRDSVKSQRFWTRESFGGPLFKWLFVSLLVYGKQPICGHSSWKRKLSKSAAQYIIIIDLVNHSSWLWFRVRSPQWLLYLGCYK